MATMDDEYSEVLNILKSIGTNVGKSSLLMHTEIALNTGLYNMHRCKKNAKAI